jgi:hypothetical protein
MPGISSVKKILRNNAALIPVHSVLKLIVGARKSTALFFLNGKRNQNCSEGETCVSKVTRLKTTFSDFARLELEVDFTK